MSEHGQSVQDRDALFARVEELEAQVEVLTARGRRSPRTRSDARAARDARTEPVSRRRVFGMLGSAAAAGAGLAVAGSALGADPAGATAVTAGAANGDALQIGGSNGCTGSTSLTSSTGGSAFSSEATGAGGVGVLGFCNNGSDVSGVTGLSSAGLGVFASGGRAPLRLSPAGTAGAPTTGDHESGELMVATNGRLFLCVLSGTPGTWRQVALSGAGNSDAFGAPTTFTAGASTGAAITLTNSIGDGSPLGLSAGSIAGAPTTGDHSMGEMFVDMKGVLFQCVEDGSPGTWVRQTPLVTLASPVRVYDSRSGQPNQVPNTQGALTFTSAPPSSAFRDVACNKNASTGATVVPGTARTLLMNLAIVSISGVGALNVYATGTTQPATANINWFAGGQVLSNAVTSACDANQHVDVAIVAGGGASTHFVIDVIGYYL